MGSVDAEEPVPVNLRAFTVNLSLYPGRTVAVSRPS